MVKNLVERVKEEKVKCCQSPNRDGFEIDLGRLMKIGNLEGKLGCGFYQPLPCKNQGELLYPYPLTPIYECKKKRLEGK